MITEVANIKYHNEEDKQFIHDKQVDFTGCFHFLFKKIQERRTKGFINHVKDKFNLNDIEYRSIESEVKQLHSASKAHKKEHQERIDEINEEINELLKERNNAKEKTKKHKKEITRSIFKLKKKIDSLNQSIKHNIVFGGREILQKISFLSNPEKAEKKKEERKSNKGINWKQYKKKLKEDKIKKDEEQKEKEKTIEEWKEEYKERRLKPIHTLGEANQKGNRFYDFDLENYQITYKPFKGKRIVFSLDKHHNKEELFKTLQEKINNESISVTVFLDTNKVWLSFEEEKLTKYAINESERRREVEIIKKAKYSKEEEKEKVLALYQKYYKLRKERRLEGKIENRGLYVDLNPFFIGYSVLQKLEGQDEPKIIKCSSFSLKYYSKKLGKDATSKDREHLNNKRKHELLQIIKRLFVIAHHYKVSVFGAEGLEIDPNQDLGREANRQIKNLWNRELIKNTITKYCALSGIEFKGDVPPAYTSFIGNLKYNYVDPVAASIEIGRREMFRFEKNKFFPPLEDTIIHTLEAIIGGDVELVKGDQTSWKELYSFASKFRWRRRLHGTKPYVVVSMSTKKSKVKIVDYL